MTNRALTAPELKRYTCCERWRLLSFVVQNTLDVGSSFLEDYMNSTDFPVNLEPLDLVDPFQTRMSCYWKDK